MRAAVIAAFAFASGGAMKSSEGPITVTSGGWSQAPTRWSIAPDGSIIDTRGVSDFACCLPIRLVPRETGPAPDRYRLIVKLLAPARARAGHKLPCKQPATDATAGKVSWGTAATLDYYTGCFDPRNKPVFDALTQATAQIRAWTKDVPVARYRDITTSEEMNAL